MPKPAKAQKNKTSMNTTKPHTTHDQYTVFNTNIGKDVNDIMTTLAQGYEAARNSKIQSNTIQSNQREVAGIIKGVKEQDPTTEVD